MKSAVLEAIAEQRGADRGDDPGRTTGQNPRAGAIKIPPKAEESPGLNRVSGEREALSFFCDRTEPPLLRENSIISLAMPGVPILPKLAPGSTAASIADGGFPSVEIERVVAESDRFVLMHDNPLGDASPAD